MRNFILFISLFFTSSNIIYPNDTTSVSNAANFEVEKPLEITLDESSFLNLSASPKSEGFKLTWSIDYNSFDHISDKKFIIKYNTKIGSKRNKKGFEGSDWKYTETFKTNAASYEVKDIIGGEKYEAYLGIINSGDENNIKNADITWSKKVKLKTKRGWGLMLIKELMDSVDFESSDSGTTLTMIKKKDQNDE